MSNSVFRKGEDAKWQVSAPSVCSLPADADGAPGDMGRSSCSKKAVELGDEESQDSGWQMGQPSGSLSQKRGVGKWFVLLWRLCCMQSSVDTLLKGVVSADRLICTELLDLLLADPGPTSFSGFVNLR